jgi:ELWxxDGT repeat protein
MQGSNAPYILHDPVRPGNVYIVYNSDPDGNFVVGAPGDVGAASVFLARSTDDGVTWSAFVPVSHPPAGVLSAFPNGSVDAAGNIVVFWYDTRGNSLIDPDGIVGNFDDRFALNLFASSSTDGGATFSNDFQVNDKNDFFDPVPGAPLRFDPDTTNPKPPDNSRMDADDTTRIGEYNGIAAVNGVAYVDWTGNSPDPPRSTPPATNATGQQIFFRQFDIVVKVTAPSNQSAVEGASQAITLGSFGDSSGGPWSVDVNWGDVPGQDGPYDDRQVSPLVKDIHPGSAGSDPLRLTNVNGTLFFQANDGVHGKELWTSNGTTSGTFMVKDILPGFAGSSPDFLKNINGVLFFAANDGVHGTEPWVLRLAWPLTPQTNASKNVDARPVNSKRP